MCRTLLKPRSLAILLFGVALVAAAGLGVWAVAMAQGPDPNPYPVISFSSSSYTVGEADGTVTVTVTLSQSSSSTVTVDYATSDGSATGSDDGGDYGPVSGTLLFSPGETTKTIVIDIYNDFCCESSETFSVTLSNPSGGSLGSPSTTTVTIVDNDSGCE